MPITFLLNGETVRVDHPDPTRTVLDWLRLDRGLTGTKEGCNEGDCGACTVMVAEPGAPWRALNACILFLPQIHGKALRTVEGISAPGGALHPVQDAMITHHGSQCGFCTPGFIMSMAAGHHNGETDHDVVLAGNLCRCTGYAPIVRAAEAARAEPRASWLDLDHPAQLDAGEASELGEGSVAPLELDAFADWYLDHPEATLVAGATDVGLWVNKAMRDITPVAFLSQIEGLRGVEQTDAGLRIGAAVNLTRLLREMHDRHPGFAAMLKRYASAQVRNAATIGGNIANGSPIGDGPPALIALNARLRLRRGGDVREIPLEEFFIAYGKQDRQPGEFVESILIPDQEDRLKCYKISKRFDQDISALLGCFSIRVSGGKVTEARIAFGGMAAIPARAKGAEAALIGKPWTQETVDAAMTALRGDYTPISDARATADYRREVAANLLQRYFDEDRGHVTQVLEAQA